MLADPRPLVTAGARAGKDAAVKVGAAAGPLRNMGRKGVALKAGYDIEADNSRIVLRLRPPGAWVIAEQGAREHTIRPRRRRARAAGRPVALGTPAGARAVVYHARAKGRRAITRAFGAARPAIPAAIHDAQIATMRRIYG